MTTGTELHVEAARCIRCGACEALCPGVFAVSDDGARVVREPTRGERPLALAARWVCPTEAIRGKPKDDASPDAVEAAAAPLFHALATSSERLRWTLSSIPWDSVDDSRAPSDLITVVREMAFSENATYSATQRFLEAFFDDIDFSNWLAVWFYEETRHPHVLVEWLRRVREPVSSDFSVKGRVSTPFMRSPVGTLITNVISEITAAQAYRHLSETSPEPVLGGIARLIAGDEARHAAAFFRFAHRRLGAETGEAVRRHRARGLEVLQAWLGGAQPVTHPVAQMIARLRENAARAPVDFESKSIRARVIRVVGILLDLPVEREEDVGPQLRELLARRGTA